ncbi:MAG: hypothetical protein R3E93_15590 [Thiothrix sp.]
MHEYRILGCHSRSIDDASQAFICHRISNRLLVFGFYPQGILDITETSSQYWVSLMLPVDVSP